MLKFYLLVLQYIWIMKKFTKISKKVSNYLYDHWSLKTSIRYTGTTLLAAFSAFVYAFAFVCFITPANTQASDSIFASCSVITGGIGGISQVIHLIFTLCGLEIDAKTMQSIFYFVLNVPLFFLAFFKIGKRFAILTLINVALSSLFIQLLGLWGFTEQIAELLAKDSGMHLARVLFAGILVGFSSAIAFKGDISCGGIDIISYYFALRKSTSVGKYTFALNGVIIVSYTVLYCVLHTGQALTNEVAFLNVCFSFVYICVTSLVLDSINTRNKKVQIRIITESAAMSSILIANFPHSTTTVLGEGGYSHQHKLIVYLVCSSNEANRVIKTARQADSMSFITITPLIQAYGNFFIKPIE